MSTIKLVTATDLDPVDFAYDSSTGLAIPNTGTSSSVGLTISAAITTDESGDLANVNVVALDIANLNAVANDLTNISAVYTALNSLVNAVNVLGYVNTLSTQQTTVSNAPTSASTSASLMTTLQSAANNIAQTNAQTVTTSKVLAVSAVAQAAAIAANTYLANESLPGVFQKQLHLGNVAFQAIDDTNKWSNPSARKQVANKSWQTEMGGTWLGEYTTEANARVGWISNYGLNPTPEGNLSTYGASSGVANATTSIQGFTNSIQFNAGSSIYAYCPLTLISGLTYTVSFFVQMDDGSVPTVGINNGTGDFGVVYNSNLASGGTTVTLITGSIYRISYPFVATTGNVNFGVVKYSGQSAKTFRMSGLQINFGNTPVAYVYDSQIAGTCYSSSGTNYQLLPGSGKVVTTLVPQPGTWLGQVVDDATCRTGAISNYNLAQFYPVPLWSQSQCLNDGLVVGGVAFTRVMKQYTSTSENVSLTVATGVSGYYTAKIELLASSNSSQFVLGLYDTTGGTNWGTAGNASYSIISGPGSVSQVNGALYQVTGLSTTIPTVLTITRNYTSAAGVSFYWYPDTHNSSTIGKANYVGRVGIWAGQTANAWVADSTINYSYYQRTTNNAFYMLAPNATTPVRVYRGGTKDMPERVSWILNNDNTLVGYDITQSGTPMWMVFNNSVLAYAGTLNSVACCNGQLRVGGSNGYVIVDFLRDYIDFPQTANYRTNGPVSKRNAAAFYNKSAPYTLTSFVNNLVGKVLPGTPNSLDTGMPNPTWVYATSTGVLVEKYDGTFLSSSSTASVSYVDIRGTNIIASNGGAGGYSYMYYVDTYGLTNSFTLLPLPNTNTPLPWISASQKQIASSGLYSVRGHDYAAILGIGNPSNTALNYAGFITNTYNTGWILNQSARAVMNDTVAETLSDGVNGVELIAGGYNPSSTTGWSSSSNYAATSAIVSSELQVTASVGFGRQIIAITTTPGTWYTVRACLRKVSGNGLASISHVGSDGSDYSTATMQTTSSSTLVPVSFSFMAYNTTSYISIGSGSSTGTGAVIGANYISVRASNSLVQYDNSNFNMSSGAWASTAGLRSTAQVVTPGELQITAVDAYGRQVLGFPTIPGKSYCVSAQIRMVSGTGTMFMGIGTSTGSDIFAPVTTGNTTPTLVTKSFVATGYLSYIYAGPQNVGAVGAIANVTAYMANMDRSLNMASVPMYGTITKAPVNTGCNMIAYSGFSTTNFYREDYNPALDAGTNDYSYSLYVKGTPTGSAQYLVARNGPALVGRGLSILALATTGYLQVIVHGAIIISTTTAILNGLWTRVMVSRISGVVYINVNGVPITSFADTTNMNNTAATFTIGNDSTGTMPATACSLTMVKMNAQYGITATYDKFIHATESSMFNAGSQVTIMGSSNTVISVSSDPDTRTYKVLTSAGVSSFKHFVRTGFVPFWVSVGTPTFVSSAQDVLVVGGTTGASIVIPFLNIREESRREPLAAQAIAKDLIPLDFTASSGGGQTDFPLQYGFTVKEGYIAGVKKFEGATKDFVRASDGILETMKFASGVSANAWVHAEANRMSF